MLNFDFLCSAISRLRPNAPELSRCVRLELSVFEQLGNARDWTDLTPFEPQGLKPFLQVLCESGFVVLRGTCEIIGEGGAAVRYVLHRCGRDENGEAMLRAICDHAEKAYGVVEPEFLSFNDKEFLIDRDASDFLLKICARAKRIDLQLRADTQPGIEADVEQLLGELAEIRDSVAMDVPPTVTILEHCVVSRPVSPPTITPTSVVCTSPAPASRSGRTSAEECVAACEVAIVVIKRLANEVYCGASEKVFSQSAIQREARRIAGNTVFHRDLLSRRTVKGAEDAIEKMRQVFREHYGRIFADKERLSIKNQTAQRPSDPGIGDLWTALEDEDFAKVRDVINSNRRLRNNLRRWQENPDNGVKGKRLSNKELLRFAGEVLPRDKIRSRDNRMMFAPDIAELQSAKPE